MPKVIDEKVRAWAVRLVQEHRGEYSTLSKALETVARQEDVGKESLRRWVNQAEVDAGRRDGVTSVELEEIKKLKAENTPQPLIMAFIDQQRVEGYAVESICRVLREQGCQVAARTYRAWTRRVGG